ncbi:MAG: hypothetical protein ACREPB_01535 [Arenimonas sp.]
MTANLRDISLNGVGLEPLEGEVAEVPKGKAKFTANTREKASERRKKDDRRIDLRLKENRRATKDRRPNKTWEDGKNL